MFFNLMQTSSSLILQATNQHAKYVIQYFLYYLLGLVTAFFIAKYIHNLSFLALGLIIPEVLLLKFASKTTFVSTGDNLVAFRKRLFFDFKYHFNLIKRIV
jgi:hypothetical protein